MVVNAILPHRQATYLLCLVQCKICDSLSSFFDCIYIMSLTEELDLIASMYCKCKEFEINESSNSDAPSFSMNLLCAEGKKLVFTCNVHDNYPLTIPTIYVQTPELLKSVNSKLQQDLHDFLNVNSFRGQPMLCVLIDWLKDNTWNYVINSSTALKSLDSEKRTTCLLQLDHMRSKSRYIKHLQSFAKELNVGGYLIFVKRFIFLILHGNLSSVNEFMVKLKCQKVDVDSSGHPCKEKMSKVLGSVIDSCLVCSDNFSLCVIELTDVLELKPFFEKIKFCDAYDKFIKSTLQITDSL